MCNCFFFIQRRETPKTTPTDCMRLPGVLLTQNNHILSQVNVQTDVYLNYQVKNGSIFAVYAVFDFMFQPLP